MAISELAVILFVSMVLQSVFQSFCVVVRCSLLFSIVLFTLSACVQTQGTVDTIPDKQKAVDGFVQLGMAYLQRGNRDAARRNFEKALEIKSGSARAYNGMALLHQLNGEIELAEKTFQRALSLDTGYSQARLNYGALLYQQKRYTEAFTAFEEASKDLGYERRALSFTYLGQTALQLKELNRAQSSFEYAINLNNQLATPNIELAELHFDKQEYSEAKQYLDAFSKLTKSSARSLWLGIRIERIFGNKDKEASYVLALKNLYPYSKEFLAYKNMVEQGQ